MTDRESLLQGILDQRSHDLPRLIYADFLEDRGIGDVDAATVEFIRESCGDSANKHAAHAWLVGNWHRLVPTFLAKWCRREMFESDYGMGNHRAVSLVWYSVKREMRSCKAWLYFDRGFLVRLWSPSYRVMDRVPASLAKDQPLQNLLALPSTAMPQLIRDRKKFQTEIEVPA